MRELHFKNPVEVKNTTLFIGDLVDNPTPKHYSRNYTVFTKFGIVTVMDFDWQNNFGTDTWTEFSTILDGELWRAELKEGRLDERRVKWMSTNFIKKCIAAYNGDLQV